MYRLIANLTLTFLSLLSVPAALAEGSGSKASQSLLTLDAPIDACLSVGAPLWQDLEAGEAARMAGAETTAAPDHILTAPTQTQIFALTFDQSWVEVFYAEGFFFVLATYVSAEVCDS